MPGWLVELCCHFDGTNALRVRVRPGNQTRGIKSVDAKIAGVRLGEKEAGKNRPEKIFYNPHN